MSGRPDLAALVARAREIGASGEPSSHLVQAACALVLDALEVELPLTFDALVAPVLSSRDPHDERLLASASGRSWVVSGSVPHVPGATGATTLLTIVRSRPFAGRERGLRLYAIDASMPGVGIHPLRTIDDDGGATVVFDAVQVGDERAIGPSRDASGAVGAALDAVTLVAVAEMLGAADAARVVAMRWVHERVQFGEPLAKRQAVAHRIADMTLACDAVRLLLEDALRDVAADGGAPDPLAVARCKLAANVRLPQVTAGAHQLHGGEGYYADRPLHRLHRRVSSLAVQLGDSRTMRRCAAGVLDLTPRI